MTSNKPDIQAFLMKQDGHYEPYVSIQRDSGCTGMVYPLVRLCDYEALQAECKKLRKDAERYRWLRDQCGTMGNLTIAKATSWELEGWSGDDPDSAIDKAMCKGDNK